MQLTVSFAIKSIISGLSIMKNKVAVIIPFYKDGLTPYESIAIQQCFKMLSAYPVLAIKPQSLQLSTEITAYPFADTISFDDDYFKDVQGYNRLMMDEAFYGAFLDYEYILIYQLDAFIFSEELAYWCDRDVDYIGAPWITPRDYPDMIKAIKSHLQYYFHTRYDVYKDGLPSDKQFDYKVGNGGFSLRRTKKFYNICRAQKEKIAFYNERDSHLFNEDIFWSVEVNRKRKVLRIPNWKTALGFSIEFAPARALNITKGKLPFGCHAWDRHLDAWRPIFKEYGYSI